MIIPYGETQPRIDESCFIAPNCVIIGDYVTCGHGAIAHGCTTENECVIGMGAVILDDSIISHGSIIAAGFVVKEHETIASGVLVAGNPASVKLELTNVERQAIKQSANNYFNYVKGYEL